MSLGLTPGLSCVGLCVIAFPAGSQGIGRLIEHDVLIGTRPSQRKKLGIPEPSPLSSIAELARRFKVHALLLETLLERHLPRIIAVGPAAKNKEPAAFWEAASRAICSMATVFRIPSHVVTKADIAQHFQGPIAIELDRRLSEPLQSSDRRVLLAAAAAIVAYDGYRVQLPGFDPARLRTG